MCIGGERKREVLYTMPLKKNALGPSEAACIEEYKVVSKEDGGWLVTLYVTTPKVCSFFACGVPLHIWSDRSMHTVDTQGISTPCLWCTTALLV